jgi:hypothetical protein
VALSGTAAQTERRYGEFQKGNLLTALGRFPLGRWRELADGLGE